MTVKKNIKNIIIYIYIYIYIYTEVESNELHLLALL